MNLGSVFNSDVSISISDMASVGARALVVGYVYFLFVRQRSFTTVPQRTRVHEHG